MAWERCSYLTLLQVMIFLSQFSVARASTTSGAGTTVLFYGCNVCVCVCVCVCECIKLCVGGGERGRGRKEVGKCTSMCKVQDSV